MARPAPTFPSSNGPRTWLITAAASPIGLRVARALLDHGDNVVLGALASDLTRIPLGFFTSHSKDDKPSDLDPDSLMDIDDGTDRADVFAQFVINEIPKQGWRDRSKVARLDARCESYSVTLYCIVTRDVAQRVPPSGPGKTLAHGR